jgi:hypothetical protein
VKEHEPLLVSICILFGLVSILSSKVNLTYLGLLNEVMTWNVCDRIHPFAIILGILIPLQYLGYKRAARAFLSICILLGLLVLVSSGASWTFSGLLNEVMAWNVCGRIHPVGIILGILMLLLYIGYMRVRARFVSVWMASKVV